MSGVGEVVELEIPPTMEYLDLARVVVSAAASVDPAFPPARVADLRLAVSELCANAIESQQRLDRVEPLTIRCILDDDRVTIEIEDHGGGFDPDALDPLPAVTDPVPPASGSGAWASPWCGAWPTTCSSWSRTTAPRCASSSSTSAARPEPASGVRSLRRGRGDAMQLLLIILVVLVILAVVGVIGRGRRV